MLRGGGCSVDDICKSINLEMNDLWPDDGQENKVTINVPKTPRSSHLRRGGEKKLTNTYKYFDADGTLVMEVLRYVYEDGRKTFLQRKPPSRAAGNGRLTTSRSPCTVSPDPARCR